MGDGYAQPQGDYQFPEIIGNINKTDFRLFAVTISKSGAGTVSPAGIFYRQKGSVLSFQAVPEEGNYIESVRLGESELLTESREEQTLQTSELTGDLNITVSFQPLLEQLPMVFSPNCAFSPAFFKPFVCNGVIINTPYGISFATAKNIFYGYERTEYGVILSTVREELENLDAIPAESDTVKVAKAVHINARGQFGVLFFGNGISQDTTYYTRAYAEYADKNSGNCIIVFGDNINSFTPGQMNEIH